MTAKVPRSRITQEYLRRRFDSAGQASAMRATTEQELVAWKAATRRKLAELTGYDTMESCPLEPISNGVEDIGDYTREHVEIQTEPGVNMTLYVLRPKGTGPFPAVMAPHGHSSGGKYAVVGRRDMQEVVDTIEQHNYDYGVQFVREGFIVFCPDARGFGERQERIARGNILASSCTAINNMAYPLGQTVTGMWAWDLSRLLDYIETREDCVRGRTGCAGLSGGGLQTLWVSALDERVLCAVISGYLYGYRESLLDQHGNCSCNYVPHLYQHVDMGDVGALIAPRPVLVETGDQDALNGASGLDNVYPQVATMRKAYELTGQGDALYHDVFKGEHRWNGVEAIPWMKKHLQSA
jgi:dienelactone hydrolase